EAGISDVGEMDRLERIIRPTTAVITNIGQAHQENFLSYDIKCTEKFQDCFIDREEQRLSALCREVQSALEHKPFHPEAEAYQQFIQQTIQKINYIKQKCPDINLDTELSQCNTRLNK
ncbi:MAG: hypothetical protein II061_00050, partial [Bacteroidaceae bacterium]|nr:hypothetical protein [Bacteroidaceae bacterium]